MPSATSTWVGVFGCLLIVGCSAASVNPAAMEIVKDVRAIEPMELDLICVEVNTSMKAPLTDGLFKTLKDLGLTAQSKQAAFGDECRYWLRYQATWGGFPEHLKTAEIEVLDNLSVIGHIRYDATGAGRRPDRLGSASGKLKPLLETLFVRVRRAAPGAEST